MTELEQKIKAKIPGEDTGIEIKRSLCAICSPSHHCGVDCYVKDGRLLKVEGTPEHPYNKGNICAKGANIRDYVYRPDRIQTPLRRVGERGEGKFEPISWEEAYREISQRLLGVREEYGPDAVAFFSGYCKWYRPILQRLCYAFGSVNFGTDDSTCNQAGVLAGMLTAGAGGGPHFAQASTFLGWAWCGYYSNHLSVKHVMALKERGGKVIIIDSRVTPAAKNLADLFLHINAGTDGALALGMANLIIQEGWADQEFLQKYTFGYEEYAAYVAQFDLETTSRITGVPQEDIREAARLFATNGPACINQSTSTLVHYVNGFQTFRAILSLSALTGNYDRPGGNVPNPPSYLHKPAGFKTREKEFVAQIRPEGKRIAEGMFPIWDKYYDEFQAMDLARQIQEGTPYPVKAMLGMGMNFKMFPQTDRLAEAVKTLDFFVDVDLFMTETAKYADIVLPACSSVERSELKAYQGGFLAYTQPAIAPLYQSKSDVDILCELAGYLELRDPWLEKGYEACMDYIIEGCGLTVEQLKASELPLKVPAAKPLNPGAYLEGGCRTPSGKFEFYSQGIAAIDPAYGLEPLPVYRPPLYDQDSPEMAADYPFQLSTGTRIGTAIHSRLHESPWARSLRKEPLCELHFDDAATLGIGQGDEVELSSPCGSIRAKAKLTSKIKPGHLQMLHGYSEANVNLLISTKHLDPYTGFPGFKATRCRIQKAQGGIG